MLSCSKKFSVGKKQPPQVDCIEDFMALSFQLSLSLIVTRRAQMLRLRVATSAEQGQTRQEL